MSPSSMQDRAQQALAFMIGVLAFAGVVLGITGLVVLYLGP